MFTDLFPRLSDDLSTAIEDGIALYKVREDQISRIKEVEDKLNSLIFNIPNSLDNRLRVASKPQTIKTE